VVLALDRSKLRPNRCAKDPPPLRANDLLPPAGAPSKMEAAVNQDHNCKSNSKQTCVILIATSRCHLNSATTS